MSPVLKAILIGLATLGAPIGFVYFNGALSPDNWVFQGGSPTNWKDTGHHGAPGPIAGASLPVLGVGAGIYWLVRRRRRKAD
jgi:hypothetical protein